MYKSSEVGAEPHHDTHASPSASSHSLSHGLSARQMSMISIAGIIGAGLFVGSSSAIATAGPAILVSYGLAGLLVLMVMRMLAEMAVANPTSGSFSSYASEAIGPWAGSAIGWLYWWYWVLIIPVEAIAGAQVLHHWMPAIPSWIFTFAILLALTATNFASVANFGELEYWFALVKVIGIIAFIAVCGAAISGFMPASQASGVNNILDHGGFMPTGPGAILGGMLVTMFSFFGAEIVTVAAGETKNPQKKIRQATNLVVWRIALFYIISVFCIVALVPWNDPQLVEKGSFQRTLEIIGIPGAKVLVDIVILVAVTSCLNAGLYTASRMLYSLAERREAPQWLSRLDGKGVPKAAVAVSAMASSLGCIVNYIFPGQVFSFLLATTGAIAFLVYLVVAISQLRIRARLEKAGKVPEFKMWFFPYLTWVVILFIVAILLYMLFSEAYRYQTLMTAIVAAVAVAIGFMRHRKKAV